MSVSAKIQPSGASFADLRAGGLSRIIDLVIAANPAVADPASQVTVSVTGGGASGGALPAGTYYAAITRSNGAGESTIGTSRSAPFTVAAGNIPRFTIPALPAGAGETLLYLTRAGGAAGSEVLYARGITGTTADAAVAEYADPQAFPPFANSTALSSLQPYLGSFRNGRAHQVFNAFAESVSAYLHGDPMATDQITDRLRSLAAVLKTLSVAADEVVSLVDANPGTLGTYVQSNTHVRAVRTFS